MSHTQYMDDDGINRVNVTKATPLPVATSNITGKFRVAFESPELPAFDVVAGTGDIVQVDGNALAASYVSISKSPWDAGNETSLTTLATFKMPVELAFGAHRSQATLGQEFSFELVDTGTPLPDVADIAIASITQTTTTLTIDTVADHGLVPGKSIGVRGCSNQLANYPALVVASIPSPRQITVTAGPGGTIPSQTITNPAGAKGFIYFRERLGRANDGMSQIFENASATNASFYIRSRSGDALTSGTGIGNHSMTVATTASVQQVAAAYTYSFAPSTEYRLNLQADRVQAMDSAVDATGQTTNRVLRTQVCPDPDSTYKFRIRSNNAKALTVINAKVVSVSKPGTTVGTFTTDRPHGLVTNDLITYYGNSNTGAAAFPEPDDGHGCHGYGRKHFHGGGYRHGCDRHRLRRCHRQGRGRQPSLRARLQPDHGYQRDPDYADGRDAATRPDRLRHLGGSGHWRLRQRRRRLQRHERRSTGRGRGLQGRQPRNHGPDPGSCQRG
jgi:hypothetical protein